MSAKHKVKLQFNEDEWEALKELKPKGFWMPEYLTAVLLDSQGLLPSGFWRWKRGKQSEWLGIRANDARKGLAISEYDPVEVIRRSKVGLTTKQVAAQAGISYQQAYRRLHRSGHAVWKNKKWRYRE